MFSFEGRAGAANQRFEDIIVLEYLENVRLILVNLQIVKVCLRHYSRVPSQHSGL